MDFGPVFVTTGKEAEVAPAFREFEIEMRIGQGFFPWKTFGSEKGIIKRIDKEGRHGDPPQ